MDNSFLFSILASSVCIVACTFFLRSISGNDSSELPDVESSVEVSASDVELLPDFVGNDADNMFVWTDEETGVQYIVYNEKRYNAGFGGITPRLNADGSLHVVNVDEVTPPAVAAE